MNDGLSWYVTQVPNKHTNIVHKHYIFRESHFVRIVCVRVYGIEWTWKSTLHSAHGASKWHLLQITSRSATEAIQLPVLQWGEGGRRSPPHSGSLLTNWQKCQSITPWKVAPPHTGPLLLWLSVLWSCVMGLQTCCCMLCCVITMPPWRSLSTLMAAGLSERSLENEWKSADDIRGFHPIPPGAMPKVNAEHIMEPVPHDGIPEQHKPNVPILPKPPEMVSTISVLSLMCGWLVMVQR